MNRKLKCMIGIGIGILAAAAALIFFHVRQRRGGSFVVCGEGWSVEAAGSTAVISLPANPAAGYSWSIQSVNGPIEANLEYSTDYNTDENAEHADEADGTEWIIVKADGEGESELTVLYAQNQERGKTDRICQFQFVSDKKGNIVNVSKQDLEVSETEKENGNTVCIIGGADGPTSIFLAGKLGNAESSEKEKTEDENEKNSQEQQESNRLTGPPILQLQDALSSAYSYFETPSGNYTWYCKAEKEGEMMGSIACGLAPLEEAKEKEKLKIPRYNKIDFAAYVVSWETMPDSMVVKEYEITDSESTDLAYTDAEAVSSTVYDEIFALDLRPDRVYEITAEWTEKKIEERGFYGSASYVIATE